MPWKHDPILQAGGECGSLMREMDWSASPLGPPETWPPELRTVVGIALGSRQPMLIVWGPEQTTLYNDGYAVMCGQRHPAAFGKPFRDLWFDIWDVVDPIISDAYNGISTSMDDIEFTMHRNGYPEETHFSFSYTPVRSPSGEVLGMFCACQEITEQVIRRREQEAERDRLRSVFEAALGAVAVLTGPQHTFSFTNRDYQMLVGHRDLTGKPIGQALPEVVGQGFVELLDRVYSTGEAHLGKATPVELKRGSDGPLEQRIVDFLYHPIRTPRGDVEGIFVQAIDVTEQHLLNRELAHRLKNQLALVQAIVNQSLRTAPDMPSARNAIGGRLAALAAAHDTIVAGHAQGATVREVIRTAITLQDDQLERRFTLSGPELGIGGRPALSLALIVHELLTNAVKYGALSTEAGHVGIVWSVDEAMVTIEWSEEGGPHVTPPIETGSGSRLVRAGLAGTTHSSVEVLYEREGVRCVITADLAGFQNNR